jgi:hypothetical protein
LQGFSLPNFSLFFCVLFSFYNLQMQLFHAFTIFQSQWISSFIYLWFILL